MQTCRFNAVAVKKYHDPTGAIDPFRLVEMPDIGDLRNAAVCRFPLAANDLDPVFRIVLSMERAQRFEEESDFQLVGVEPCAVDATDAASLVFQRVGKSESRAGQ